MSKQIVQMPIADLKPHPMQAELFGDVTDDQVKDLADDIVKNGLRLPVEALPDKTILCGHQRVRAAKRLGRDTITVWVRDDLAADPKAAGQHFIEDNLTRRQLDTLDRVRCLRALMDVKDGKPSGIYAVFTTGRRLDAIGRKLGIPRRTISRYFRILDTPAQVQRAFQRGALGVVDASRVAGLPTATQADVAAQIDAGANPAKVVDDALALHLSGKPKRKQSGVSAELAKLAAELKRTAAAAKWVPRLTPAAAGDVQSVRDALSRLVGDLAA